VVHRLLREDGLTRLVPELCACGSELLRGKAR